MTAIDFKNTVIPCYGAMLAMGRNFLGNPDAEDVVQDVLRNLWERHEEIKVNDVKAYALRSVRNRCIDLIKTKRSEVEIEESDCLAIDDSENQREREFEYLEKIQKIEDAITSLKEPSKTVINLNLKGKGCTEIALLTGLSEQNIRKILSRTRQKLREMIKV